MSATRDKTQRFSFVYSNLYQIYKKGKENADHSESTPDPTIPIAPPVAIVKKSISPVIKTGELKQQNPEIRPYNPPEFIGKRIVRPEVIAASKSSPVIPPTAALESLKQNLKSLNDLHARLRFMLQELEQLVKE